jgi:ATP-dependent helicase YprA (DUF1998 family)/very-short-patch-repair endonuclease
MDVFQLRDSLISDYREYITSFINIKDQRIKQYVDRQIEDGLLWPDALVQLNPAFQTGKSIDALIDEGILHPGCREIFKRKSESDPIGKALRLYKHQEDSIRTARDEKSYVLTTGTGSGKSLSYIIPIVDFVLRHPDQRGIKAIIVYPMNALANSQLGELKKFLNIGVPEGSRKVTFERYTGQESDSERNRITANPPDILLTNYVMLELILTRPTERMTLVTAAEGLQFLVLDELHTYRGRQGADVAMLVRRVKSALKATHLQCVGTSATMSSSEDFVQQKNDVAEVASKIFGTQVSPENIIGETLQRSTSNLDFKDPESLSRLKERIPDAIANPPNSFEQLIKDPLACWIETTHGVRLDPTGTRLVRARPKSLSGKEGSAMDLSILTQIPEHICQEAISKTLMKGFETLNPTTQMPSFAFRLHQFISRGDTVYASVEDAANRYITIHGQQFAPGSRDSVLLPLAFCRECGQDYYVGTRTKNEFTGVETFIPRDFNFRSDEENENSGFLYFNQSKPWPVIEEQEFDKLPEDWIEEGRNGLRVRSQYSKYRPELIRINKLGEIDEDGTIAHFVPSPLRFCLNCGVEYSGRQTSDFSKFSRLGSGGRSTDTTILSLSLIRSLRLSPDPELRKEARKLLSFTDNRQDASLQSGHFNDFIEIALLRSALFKASIKAGNEGLTHEVLTQKVFDALGLDFAYYAYDPNAKYALRIQTERAFREVLGYRVYRDLKRGWRITSPNLEQCGLLNIDYQSLDEVCRDKEPWINAHPALSSASPDIRMSICKVLLDYMRRELAIDVPYLDHTHQEAIRNESNQNLKDPWGIDEDEEMEFSATLYPRSRIPKEDFGGDVFLSSKSGFGQYLRRSRTLPEYTGKLNVDATKTIIQDLLNALIVGGILRITSPAKTPDGVHGYKINASILVWKAGDGEMAFHDPLRVPNLPEEGGKTNAYFVNFYKTVGNEFHGLEAHEHTAQVPANVREQREAMFRTGDLPILYCSPTMELGVDISELNAVNMRNIPPTPANYAQRSGRAGRQGQPALVFSYCSFGNSHDQYYFKKPELMVAGVVSPPRLDLANEDLVRSHIHAVWLAEAKLNLGRSLRELIDITGEEPTLALNENVQECLNNPNPKIRSNHIGIDILQTIGPDLTIADWYTEDWLAETLNQINLRFENACERWRSMFRNAKAQQKNQQRVIDNLALDINTRNQAVRLRREAESQINLLIETDNVMQSDFYSYRYFASEGFLPGYSFPRLPISAFIPARRQRQYRDEFLSRPRFLAISEFGPRSIIYHEGSRYLIYKVTLPVSEGEDVLATVSAKICKQCGFIHIINEDNNPNICIHCSSLLEPGLNNLFRMQNVITKRKDGINSDEEERLRMGFEIRTALRFQSHAGVESMAKNATIQINGQQEAKLTYANAATISRINLGWRRRTNPDKLGFELDIDQGTWAKKPEEDDGLGDDNPRAARLKTVIPFVEDTKNSLLFEPAIPLEPIQMASLQAALKSAIQIIYQLEDSELAAEPLPTPAERKAILFFEAAEGGAGVLRRIIEDTEAFVKIAKTALELCHFDPETGEDKHRGPKAREDCEAACYDCLMSYYNQGDHRLLDRKKIKDLLLGYSRAEVFASPGNLSRAEHLRRFKNLCGSDLEKEWLDELERKNFNLPSHAQELLADCGTRPDFLYKENFLAIYVDGPHHDFPERKNRDRDQESCLRNLGYDVIRFGYRDDWDALFNKFSSIFNPHD